MAGSFIAVRGVMDRPRLADVITLCGHRGSALSKALQQLLP